MEVTLFIRHDDGFIMSFKELWGEVRSGEWADGHVIQLCSVQAAWLIV